MTARERFGAVALAIGLLAGNPAFAAGNIGDDDESQRLAIECLIKAAEKLPKIYSLTVVSETLDQHGDMFDGAFLVNVLHRQVYWDFQCGAGMVTDTDLYGKTFTKKRIDKVWLSYRVLD